MNALAREVLVTAALNGVRQITGDYYELRGNGACAFGVFHRHMHRTLQDARDCRFICGSCWQLTLDRFGITKAEAEEIIKRNDDGWDFLQIARKVGVPEEPPCAS